MKSLRSKSNAGFVCLIFLSLILGCQPPGGELLPIGGDGIEITTSRFEKDTAVISEGGVEIKFYGSWENESFVRLRAAINNQSNWSCRVKFNQMSLIDANGKAAAVSGISEKPDFKSLYESGQNQNLPIIEISAGEKKSYLLSFATMINIPTATEQTDFFNLIFPIEINGQIKEYKIRFKTVTEKSAPGKSDPEDWK